MPRPTYNYFTDELHRIDEVVIAEVIQEAESYTQGAVVPEPLHERLGRLATNALVAVGHYCRFLSI